MNINIRSNERVAIVGKTGSGKTYLAEKLAKPIKRLVVVDAKGKLKGKFNTVDWDIQNPTKDKNFIALRNGENVRLRIPPLIADTKELSKMYDKFFYLLYTIGNLTIYIDEVYGVIPPRATVTTYLNALYTRGRELGISVWASTQRPSWIPLEMLSEADVFFVFKLQLPQDRKRMADVIGNEVLTPVTDKHGFYFYSTEQDRPIYTRGLSR